MKHCQRCHQSVVTLVRIIVLVVGITQQAQISNRCSILFAATTPTTTITTATNYKINNNHISIILLLLLIIIANNHSARFGRLNNYYEIRIHLIKTTELVRSIKIVGDIVASLRFQCGSIFLNIQIIYLFNINNNNNNSNNYNKPNLIDFNNNNNNNNNMNHTNGSAVPDAASTSTTAMVNKIPTAPILNTCNVGAGGENDDDNKRKCDSSNIVNSSLNVNSKTVTTTTTTTTSKCLCQNTINLNLNNFFINFYKNDKIIKLLTNNNYTNNNNNNNSSNLNKNNNNSGDDNSGGNSNDDSSIDFSDSLIFKKNFSGNIKIFIIRKNSNSNSDSPSNCSDDGGNKLATNNTNNINSSSETAKIGGNRTIIECTDDGNGIENLCVNTELNCGGGGVDNISSSAGVECAGSGTLATDGCTEGSGNVCTRDVTEMEFKQILGELKRKIEQTERMNWLCLTKRPMVPPNRKTSLPKHSDVKKRFLEICNRTLSDEVKSALRLPAFDSYEWEDADVLHLMQTMFMELGLLDKFNIPAATLREWLYEVYKHYNEVPFHNFRHSFCVAQMMYAITWRVDLINRLGELEVLILLVSCICHDLDHPGYNNIYQINARTELALRYNDISPLENHHCSIAFRLLEHPDCNIFKTFPKESYKEIREGIIRCILATDMARHNEILDQFKEITPVFDLTNRAHTNLLCMVLIKVADISNEARPMDVAEPWLDRLLQEFFAQSALEKSEGLPVTPFMDPDKVSKPGSQVRFIGLVLLPLFEALGDLLPELQDFIITPVRVALDYYRRLNDAQTKSRKSMAETEGSSESGSPLLPRSQSGMSMRSKRSIPSQKSTSRNSVDDQTNTPIELHDLPEGSESGDSETQTEVDVAEKTSKFKVDTEGMGRCKNSQPGSRKGSREKRPSMCGEYYISSSGRMVRGSHGNIHSYHSNRCNFGANRAVSLDQYGTNNRRMSEGLPAVTSDTQVFYNHFQHHHNHHLSHGHNHQSHFQSHFHANSSETDGTTHSSADAKLCEEECENMNESNLKSEDKSLLINAMAVNNANLPPISGGGTNNQTNKLQNSSRDGATKSFISRLRQLTGRLSFSFDKEPRRNNNGQAKNNNAESRKGGGGGGGGGGNGGGGYCCSISPLPKAKQQLNDVIGKNASRNRAYSLDVPPNRNRYSCSSGDGSRKSSSSTTTKNEEYVHPKCGINITIDHDDNDLDGNDNNSGGVGGGAVSSCNI